MLQSNVCYGDFVQILDDFPVFDNSGGDKYDVAGKGENKGRIDKEENEGKTDKQDSSPIVYIMGRPGLLAGT